jgi:hypothetical protein
MWRASLLLVLSVALSMAACKEATGVGEAKVLGTVEFYGDPLVVTIPDTIAVGATFEVAVRTYGGGCETIGPTETTVRGDTIVVAPYDFTTQGVDVVCTMELKHFHHSVSLSWPTAGDLHVLVRGWVEPAGAERTYPYRVVAQ